MGENKLKACPFCGGVAEYRHGGGHWVACTECGAATWHGPSEAQAIAEWNRRPASPLQAELRSALEHTSAELHKIKIVMDEDAQTRVRPSRTMVDRVEWLLGDLRPRLKGVLARASEGDGG